MKPFWTWLCRFAFRRLKVNDPTRRAPVGLPLMRDPDNRCHAYEPRPRQAGDFTDCQSDGHYLCRECCHLDPTSENGERFGLSRPVECVECGAAEGPLHPVDADHPGWLCRACYRKAEREHAC